MAHLPASIFMGMTIEGHGEGSHRLPRAVAISAAIPAVHSGATRSVPDAHHTTVSICGSKERHRSAPRPARGLAQARA